MMWSRPCESSAANPKTCQLGWRTQRLWAWWWILLISWEIGRKCTVKLLPLQQQKPKKPIDSSEFLMKILSLAKLGIIWEVSEMISLELLKNGKKNLQHLTCHFDKRGRILLDSYLSKSSSFCIIWFYKCTVAFIVLACNLKNGVAFCATLCCIIIIAFSSWESEQHLELIDK